MKRISLITAYRANLIFTLLLVTDATYLHRLWGDVPSWRANRNGVYATPHAPKNWESNLLFEIPIESKSNGTPILVGEQLIFTAEPAKLICVDARNGDLLWSRSNDLSDLNNLSKADREQLERQKDRIEQAELDIRKLRNDVKRLERSLEKDPNNPSAQDTLNAKYKEVETLEETIKSLQTDPQFTAFITPTSHNTNGYSSYTPYCDGERIFAAFGLGVVVAYDLQGNRLWAKFLEHPDHRWGGATMPQIVDGKLIVRFDDYLALDPDTGEILWRTPSDVVFGTPSPFMVEDEHFLFTPRGEVLRVDDGAILQEGLVYVHPTRGWSIFNTPSIVGDVIFAVSGVEKENGDAYAYRIPNELEAFNRSGLELLWHTKVDKDRYYASPLLLDGIMYIVTRENKVTTLDAETGEIIYTHQIKGVRGTAYPSMVSAGKYIYLGVDDGALIVLKPGRTFQEIARHNVGPYRSTPIFSPYAAYLRTYEKLQAVAAF